MESGSGAGTALAAAADQPHSIAKVKDVKTQAELMVEAVIKIFKSEYQDAKQAKETEIKTPVLIDPAGDANMKVDAAYKVAKNTELERLKFRPFGSASSDFPNPPSPIEDAAIRLAELSMGAEKLLKPETEEEGKKQVIEALLDLPPLLSLTEAELSKDEFKPNSVPTEFYRNWAGKVKEINVNQANIAAKEALEGNKSGITPAVNHVDWFIFLSDFMDLGVSPASERAKLLENFVNIDEATSSKDEKEALAFERTTLQERILQLKRDKSTVEEIIKGTPPGNIDERNKFNFHLISLTKAIDLFEILDKSPLAEYILELQKNKAGVEEKIKNLPSGNTDIIKNLTSEFNYLGNAIEFLEALAGDKQNLYKSNISSSHLLRLHHNLKALEANLSSGSKTERLESIGKEMEDLGRSYFKQIATINRQEVLSQSKLADDHEEIMTLADIAKKLEKFFSGLPIDLKPDTSLAIENKFKYVEQKIKEKEGEIIQAPIKIKYLEAEISTVEKAQSHVKDLVANLNAMVKARYAKHAIIQAKLITELTKAEYDLLSKDMGPLINNNIPTHINKEKSPALHRVLAYYYHEKQQNSTNPNDAKIYALLRFFGETEDVAVTELRALFSTGGDYVLPRADVGDKITFTSNNFAELNRGDASFAAAAKALILMDILDKTGLPMVHRDRDGNFHTNPEIDAKYSGGNINEAILHLYGPADTLINQAYKGQWFNLNGKYSWYNIQANSTSLARKTLYPLTRAGDILVAASTTSMTYVPAVASAFVAPWSIFGLLFAGSTYFTIKGYVSRASDFDSNKNKSKAATGVKELYLKGIRHGQTPVLAMVPHINPLTEADKTSNRKIPGWKKLGIATGITTALGGAIGIIVTKSPVGAAWGAGLGATVPTIAAAPKATMSILGNLIGAPIKLLGNGLKIIGKVMQITIFIGLAWSADRVGPVLNSITGHGWRSFGVADKIENVVSWAASKVMRASPSISKAPPGSTLMAHPKSITIPQAPAGSTLSHPKLEMPSPVQATPIPIKPINKKHSVMNQQGRNWRNRVVDEEGVLVYNSHEQRLDKVVGNITAKLAKETNCPTTQGINS